MIASGTESTRTSGNTPWLLAALVLPWAIPLVLMSPGALFDFDIYWHATRAFWAGKNPYALPHYSSYLTSPFPDYTLLPTLPNNQVMSPPGTFLIFTPFALLPLAVAHAAFGMLLVAILCLAVVCWSEALGVPVTGRIASRRNAVRLLSLPFALVYYLISWGSVGWLGLIGLTAMAYCIRRDRLFGAGLSTFFFTVKLHLFIPVILGLVVYSVIQRKFRLFAGIAAGLSTPLLVAIHNPHVFEWYRTFITNAPFQPFTNSTLPSIAVELSGIPALRWVVVTAGAALGTAVFLRNAPTLAQRIAVTLPFSLLFAPYAWGHDLVLALPAVILSWTRSWRPTDLLFWTAQVFTVLLVVVFWVPDESFVIYSVGLVALVWPAVPGNSKAHTGVR